VTREAPGWTTLLGIGGVMAGLFAAGALIGWWLDGALNTGPILVVSGTALGLVGGITYTVVQLRQFLKE
jgi:F0F1-type ATP synthase assembly protein I